MREKERDNPHQFKGSIQGRDSAGSCWRSRWITDEITNTHTHTHTHKHTTCGISGGSHLEEGMDGQPVRKRTTHGVRTVLPTQRPFSVSTIQQKARERESSKPCSGRPTQHSIQRHAQLINGKQDTKKISKIIKKRSTKRVTRWMTWMKILGWPNVCIDEQSALSRFQMPGLLWAIEAIVPGLLEPMTLPHSPQRVEFHLTFYFPG